LFSKQLTCKGLIACNPVIVSITDYYLDRLLVLLIFDKTAALCAEINVIVNINMTHIAPWAACEGLMPGATPCYLVASSIFMTPLSKMVSILPPVMMTLIAVCNFEIRLGEHEI
jgi:hypothetical protein